MPLNQPANDYVLIFIYKLAYSIHCLTKTVYPHEGLYFNCNHFIDFMQFHF